MAYAGENEPDLRASDAERDAVVTELGQHFQDGRLDKAEFDQRISAAMAARTRRDLAVLLADLPGRQPDSPPPASAGPAPVRARPRPPLLYVLPLIIAAVLIASLLGAGWHHRWYLGLIIAVLVVRLRILGRRRQGTRPPWHGDWRP